MTAFCKASDKKTNGVLLHILFAFLFALLLSACSDSEPEDIGEPYPKADPILRPFISADGSLINKSVAADQDPDAENEQTVEIAKTEKILFDSEILIDGTQADLMITLDTDGPVQTPIDGTQFLQHTTLPEYALYSSGRKIMLFEFASRYHHELIDLETLELEADSGPYGRICDLRRVITPDNLAFERRQLIFKDALSAFVILSSAEDCAHPDQFFQLEIKASDKEKDKFIVEKTHLVSSTSGNQTEDDEVVISNSSDPVVDLELPQWLLNHTLQLKSEPNDDNKKALSDYSKLLAKRNDRRHTFKKYTAQLREVNSALAYADTPVVDKTNFRVGLLGFDIETNQLRFYLHNPATKRNNELWQLELAADSDPALTLPVTNPVGSDTIGVENKPYRHYPNRNAILVEVDGNIVRFTHDDLFNDDRSTERASRLLQPFYDNSENVLSTALGNIELHLDYDTDSVAILDRMSNNLFYAKQGANPVLVKRFNETNLTDYEIATTRSRIFISKNYGPETKALTSLRIDNSPAIESTLIPLANSSAQWALGKIDQTAILNMADSESGEIKAFDLSLLPFNNAALSNDQAIPNSLFVRIKDSRFHAETKEYWALLYSGTINRSLDSRLYLLNPRLYDYDLASVGNRGPEIAIKTSLGESLTSTMPPEISTLRIISEQPKTEDIKKPFEIEAWGFRYRNFAQYDYRSVVDGSWTVDYDPYFDTGYFPDPIEEIDDGTTPIDTGPDKPKP